MWGWNDGFYVWNAGYWGPHIGFYVGINYGFGYFGEGFAGGEWRGGEFFYNRSVTRVGLLACKAIYSATVRSRKMLNFAQEVGRCGQY